MTMKQKKIYVLSTIHIYKEPPKGAPHKKLSCYWRGWFSSEEKAEDALLRNIGHYQDNWEQYAVIESVTEGFSRVEELQWYKFINHGRFWNPDTMTLRKCRKPKLFKHTNCFCGLCF